MYKILFLLLVNLAMYLRTLRFKCANDSWEIYKCECKEPLIIEASDGRGGKFNMCKKCGIKERPNVGFWTMLHHHFFGVCYWKLKLAHCMTLSVHIINTTLIYLAFGHNNISFLTALLFAIHPVATEGSSVWLSGRNYGTSALLTLLMKCLPIATPIIYIAIFRFALIGVPAPAMFIRSKWWFWILLIPIMVILRKKTVRQSTEMKFVLVSQTRKPIAWHNIILVFKTIGYAFCVCLFPSHLGIHHVLGERFGLTEPETKHALRKDGFFWLGIILSCTMFYLFVWHWNNPITYGLFWWFLFILPWSNVVTIHQFFAERYIVLSLIGLMYVFVNLLTLIPLNFAIAIYSGFLGYYITRCQWYLRRYADVLRSAEDDTYNFEDSAAAWRWRGGLERNLNLLNESFISWMKAWHLRPYDFGLNANIAAVLASQGRLEEAQKFIDMANKAPKNMLSPELQAKWAERMKAFQEQIDKDKIRKSSFIKQGRNELCKCGSGRKFKNCCGK